MNEIVNGELIIFMIFIVPYYRSAARQLPNLSAGSCRQTGKPAAPHKSDYLAAKWKGYHTVRSLCCYAPDLIRPVGTFLDRLGRSSWRLCRTNA